MTTKAIPSKKHHNQTVYLYSTFWKESDKFGQLLRGVYKHVNGKPIFEFVTPDGYTQVFARNEWVVISDKLAVWLQEYRLWITEKNNEYRKGYCDALEAVIRHSLMD